MGSAQEFLSTGGFVFMDVSPGEPLYDATLRNIQDEVCAYFNIGPADFTSRRRYINTARPRQIACWLAKKLTTCSYPQIGLAFGGRDHTTILHACRTIENLRDFDDEIKEATNNLLGMFREAA